MSLDASQKRSSSPCPEARQPKRARVNRAPVTPTASISTGDVSSKSKTNTNIGTNTSASINATASTMTNPRPRPRLILTFNKDKKPSSMSSKGPPKRAASPSAEPGQNKRLRIGLKSNKSITPGSVDNASSDHTIGPKENPTTPSKKSAVVKLKLPKSASKNSPRKLKAAEKENIVIGSPSDIADETSAKKTKTKANAAPRTNQFVAINSPARKSAARKPLSTIEIGEKENDVVQGAGELLSKAKAKANSPPRTNQFVPINAASLKSATRKPLRKLEGAENSAIDNQMRQNNTENELDETVPLASQALLIDPTLPKPPPRNLASTFGAPDKKAVALWMRANNAAGTRGKREAFQDLLYSLGCQDPSFDKYTLMKFDQRTERFISRIKKALKECGAISFLEDDKQETHAIFADWTIIWLDKDWDGAYDTRTYYTDNYLEKYSPADEAKVLPVELPVDEPFEEEADILVVEEPNELQATNVTDADAGDIGVRECDRNPYGMADWKLSASGGYI